MGFTHGVVFGEKLGGHFFCVSSNLSDHDDTCKSHGTSLGITLAVCSQRLCPTPRHNVPLIRTGCGCTVFSFFLEKLTGWPGLEIFKRNWDNLSRKAKGKIWIKWGIKWQFAALWNCGGLKCVAFFNFAAFSIFAKKLWQNSRRFDIHSKIQGVLKFAPFLCSW